MKPWRWIASLAMPISCSVSAAWISADDVYLRADIQTLADAGVIKVPVTTYPLMWSGVIADLKQSALANLSPALQARVLRVEQAYQQTQATAASYQLDAVVASRSARFQGFGADYREQAAFKASAQYHSTDFIAKASAVVNADAFDDKTWRMDESYLSALWGNWWFTAGKLDQWWGPGLDTGLIRTTNAEPLPSLMITRHQANAFETPWLSWIGPWTLTAGFSLFEADRHIPHAVLWNMRASIRPIPELEIGGSWMTQFCGEGEECDLESAFRSITGQKDCRNDTGDGCTNYGNQMAGFDLRYSDSWFNVPVGLYLERTCEDALGAAPWDITDCENLVGADTYWGQADQQYRLLFEYSTTLEACGTNEEAFNCFYEHGTYRSGMRYYGRTLGSTYGSDSKAYVLGLIGQFSEQRSLKVFARYLKLNEDGRSPSSVYVPAVEKEDVWLLESSYRFPIWQGMLTLGGFVQQQKLYEVNETNTDVNVFSRYQYRF